MTVKRLCTKTAMSRQNYYKVRTQREVRQVDLGLMVELVERERQQQPRLGTRKLHKLLGEELKQLGVRMGRDLMFKVLGERELLIPPLPKVPRTTDSRHRLPVYRNLIENLEATAPNQIWVSDLTYLRMSQNFLYLSLIMDRYSRKIVGYHLSDTLEAQGCVYALKAALKDLPKDRYPIHHSDRGCQYCSHEYVEQLQARGLPVSMTQELHCYENAHAERVNGILKQEYGLGSTFRTKEQAQLAVAQAVWLYNNRRPHLSLQYKSPAQVHRNVA